MPRSSKAPPLPPEPDINELIQEDVARIKRLLGLDVNRLAIGDEIEGIVPNGLFGPTDFTITGVNVIEFVNVSTSIAPSQTGVIFPGQVAGLTVTPQAGSNTQLNLVWTAITTPDFNYYNVYRGISPGSSSKIAQPVTNSYNNTGLNPGTTYYYQVSTTNDAELEGLASLEVSGTTTGISPMLELTFDDHTDNDTSINHHTVNWIGAVGVNGYTTGQFGDSIQFNTPVTPGASTKDGIKIPDHITVQINTSVGFSFSCWVYPVDLTAAVGWRRFIVEKHDTNNNSWSLSIDPAGILYFLVTKAGSTIKRQISGFVVNSWQHIGAVYDSVANTVRLYRNGVEGTTSTVADIGGAYVWEDMTFGCHFSGLDTASTYYEGRLDEIRYYQKVLTATQITNLMNTNAP